jgi:hypothetical protein
MMGEVAPISPIQPSQIYYEPQRGSLCRLHALNAFFNRKEIDDARFEEFKTEYIATISKNPAYAAMNCDSDFLYLSTDSFVAHILKYHYNTYTRTIFPQSYSKTTPIAHTLQNPQLIDKLTKCDFIFTMSPDHIYGYRMCETFGLPNPHFTLHKVDSLSGVSQVATAESKHKLIEKFIQIASSANLSIMFPIDIAAELIEETRRFKSIIGEYKTPEAYFNALPKGITLGAIEIPLNTLIDIIKYRIHILEKSTPTPYQTTIIQKFNLLLAPYDSLMLDPSNLNNTVKKIQHIEQIYRILS